MRPTRRADLKPKAHLYLSENDGFWHCRCGSIRYKWHGTGRTLADAYEDWRMKNGMMPYGPRV